jgi:hypothetical protein
LHGGFAEHLGEAFRWCHPAERLAWSAVELLGDGVEFLLGEAAEV